MLSFLWILMACILVNSAICNTGPAQLAPWQRHIRKLQGWLTKALQQSSCTVLYLWFLSVWLPRSVKSKQGRSYDGAQGFQPYRGPPTGIVCQSESWLTSEGVYSLTRGGLLLSVTLLCEWSWEEALWENGYDSQRQNKSVSFVLKSHPNFDFIFMSHSVLREQKQQKQKE